MTFPLTVGQTIARSDLHRQVGGRLRSRISPSATTPNVMLFTGGTLDGFTGRHVHFTGEGAPGVDHRLIGGNAALARHAVEGRTLRLFRPDQGLVRYLGAYTLDAAIPWLSVDAQDHAHPHHPTVETLVFRLLPVDGDPVGLLPAAPVPEQTQVEETDLFDRFRPPPGHRRNDPIPIEAAAQHLLTEYRDHLRGLGHDVRRYRIRPADTLDQIAVDLFDHTTNHLITATGSTARTHILGARGSIFDQARFFTPTPHLALLTPTPPRADLAALCARSGLHVIHPSATGEWQQS
ncbi:hypothetical protein [Streptacidiphilus sp. EB103A]|uniref:hypothetical protein n=1 Tax=Streptacidiphilus sp. EB103A TaxID=3156275 RepID=UPI003513447D